MLEIPKPDSPCGTVLLGLYALIFVIGTAQTGATQGPPTAGQRPDAVFFDPEVVQDIELEVLRADMERMHAALPERIYVPATFRWGDQVLKNVGFRYKGNSSSRPTQTHKRGFLIKFSEFEKKQRFLGLRRVSLDNGVQFGSLFSERMITDILREVGVRCSRCNYAKVQLNGEYIGVYVNVERIDQSFLKRTFPGMKGVLYKNHMGGPGADFRHRGDDPQLYARTFEVKEGKKRVRPTDIVDFIKGMDGKDKAFDLRASFDVDSFLWQTAVLLLAGAFDQYTGWGPHNYYLFHAPATDSTPGRWHYLTWDLDVGFADSAFGRLPVLAGWHAAWPTPVHGRPLLERIIDDPKLLELYRQRARQLLEKQFDPENLSRRLDQLYAQIQDDLKHDPFPKGRVTNRGERSYQEVIASMKQFMARRHASALAQLENPGPRPRPLASARLRPRGRGARGRGAGGRRHRPGPASADAPSELLVVGNTPDGIELGWKDNATGERGVIVQRCSGADNQPFRNLKGFPGENLTRATDQRVEPGKTYRYRIFAVRPTRQGLAGTGPSNIVTVKVKAR